MFCKYCGGVIKTDSRFCDKCGKEVSDNRVLEKESAMLIICKTCNQEIANTAVVCPFCGAKTFYGEKSELTKKVNFWGKVAAILMWVGIFMMLFGFIFNVDRKMHESMFVFGMVLAIVSYFLLLVVISYSMKIRKLNKRK